MYHATWSAVLVLGLVLATAQAMAADDKYKSATDDKYKLPPPRR